jgi:hypothetical protein
MPLNAWGIVIAGSTVGMSMLLGGAPERVIPCKDRKVVRSYRGDSFSIKFAAYHHLLNEAYFRDLDC